MGDVGGGRGPARGDRRAATATLLAGGGATVAMGALMGALGTELPSLGVRLHAPVAALGLLFGAYRLGSLAGAATLGRLMDRRRPGHVLALAILLMAAGWALVPGAAGLAAACAALALYGLGSGAHLTGTMTLAGRVARPALAAGLLQVAFAAGSAAGPPLAVLALSVGGGTTALTWALAGALLLALPSYGRGPAAPGTPAPGREMRGTGAGAGTRGPLLRLAALAALYLGLEMAFTGWSVTILRGERTASSLFGASWVPAAFWAATAASGALPGLLRRPPAWIVPAGGLAGAAALAGLAAGAGGQAGAVALAAALGTALGPVYPLALARASTLAPAMAGRAVGTVAAAAQAGAIALPLLSGLAIAARPALGFVPMAAAALGIAALGLPRARL